MEGAVEVEAVVMVEAGAGVAGGLVVVKVSAVAASRAEVTKPAVIVGGSLAVNQAGEDSVAKAAASVEQAVAKAPTAVGALVKKIVVLESSERADGEQVMADVVKQGERGRVA